MSISSLSSAASSPVSSVLSLISEENEDGSILPTENEFITAQNAIQSFFTVEEHNTFIQGLLTSSPNRNRSLTSTPGPSTRFEPAIDLETSTKRRIL